MENTTTEPEKKHSHDKATHCSSCNSSFGFFNSNQPCSVCHVALCKKCRWWLLLPKDLRDATNNVQGVCESCFKSKNTLAMDRKMDVYGPESGLPVVLVHGGLGNRHQWLPQIDELSKYYRLYVPDLPGHGSRFKEELTLENAMETIAKVIETLPDKKALIIGYSLGAYISMAFAGHYPQMCVGVIAGGAGADLSRPLNHFAVKVIGSLTTLLSPPTIVTASLGQASKEEVPITEIEPLLTSGSLSNVRVTEAINHKILLWPGYADYLAKYDGPILFLDGEKDTRNGEERWMKASKNGKLKIIKGAGHLMTHSSKHKGEYLAAMLEFAESIGYKKHTTITE